MLGQQSSVAAVISEDHSLYKNGSYDGLQS